MQWKQQALKHFKELDPNEGCGLLVNFKGKLRFEKCKNLAKEQLDQFILDPFDWASIEDKYGHDSIQGIVHSHPHTEPVPSPADRIAAVRTGLMWYICNPRKETWNQFMPENYKSSLIGRPWIWKIADCWELVREYYRAEFGIILKTKERPEDPEYFQNNPFFEKYFEDLDFRELKDDESLKKGDVILMNVCGNGLNHVGVITSPEENLILHHIQGRLSCKEDYGEWLRKCTGKRVRYVHSTIATD